MSAILPKLFALRSTEHDTYLRYTGDRLYSLDFNSESVFNPSSKFELVPAAANTNGTGLVSIRSCHSKKFIGLRSQFANTFGAMDADEPDEDQSSWGCTLFEPQILEESNTNKLVRLLHFAHNGSVHARTFNSSVGGRIDFWRINVNHIPPAIYEVIDLESLPVLPRHVAFKGNNGKYLTAGLAPNHNLKFTSTEMADPRSWFEVTTDAHGRVRIMSHFNKFYWTLIIPATSIIWAIESNPTGTDTSARRSLFSPVEIEKNVFAFRSHDNGNFCGEVQMPNNIIDDGAIFATYQTLVTETRFLVEELVLSRRIYNTDFHLLRATIYGESPINMVTANASNNTSVENTVEFKLSYTDTKSSMWTSTESKMLGMGVSASIRIPFVGSFGAELYGEHNDSYEWGETISSENTLETTYTVVVPPHSSITVSVMATKGYCDVPFSYYQKDKLYDGNYVVYHKHDGLYTGMNSYNFRYEVAEINHQTSRTDHRTIYMEQKIPMPLDAKVAESRALASSVMATQEEKSPLPLEDIEGVPLPLKETPDEQKVELSVEETTSEVQKLSQ